MSKKLLVGTTAATIALGVASTGRRPPLPKQRRISEAHSLAKVATSDKNKFDKNSGDFDVVTEAVLAVLAAKPDQRWESLPIPT